MPCQALKIDDSIATAFASKKPPVRQSHVRVCRDNEYRIVIPKEYGRVAKALSEKTGATLATVVSSALYQLWQALGIDDDELLTLLGLCEDSTHMDDRIS